MAFIYSAAKNLHARDTLQIISCMESFYWISISQRHDHRSTGNKTQETGCHKHSYFGFHSVPIPDEEA